MPDSTPILQRLSPRQVRAFSPDCSALGDLRFLGCQFPADGLLGLSSAYPVPGASMDAAPGMITPAAPGVPLQFLQHILPGIVRTVTGARKVDELAGRTIAGSWHDEEIVQTVVEHLGQARPYGDSTDTVLADFTIAYERRTVVRFEEGFTVSALENDRAAHTRAVPGLEKRAAVASALSVEQNRIGFYGYNAGTNMTYGFLNDPGLPAYRTLPPGSGGGTEWTGKTFAEITADIRLMASCVRNQSRDLVNPEGQPMILALATASRDALHVTNEHGASVLSWLRETYPHMSVKSAPELDKANGSQNVAYLYAEDVSGAGGEGNQKTVEQFVPAVLRLVGVENRAKGTLEVFSNATAGVMWRMPLAVVRVSGI